jgi:hypothetical protein
LEISGDSGDSGDQAHGRPDIYQQFSFYWSAGILPASGTSALIRNSKSLPPEKGNTIAGKMPALRDVVAVTGKMPALVMWLQLPAGCRRSSNPVNGGA